VILVTGGTGFVGPKVVHAIRAEGRPVRALVRNPGSKAARTLATWGCEVAQGDMTDRDSVRRAVEGCEAVVHLVALVRGKPELYERVMAQGTRDLVDAAKEAGVRRFVLMSALGVHEGSKDLTPYYRAKWDQEQVLAASGLEHVIFRPSFVFGRDGGVLAIVVRAFRFSPVVGIPGTRRMQPIWVEDVAAFFARALSTPEAANRTFDLVGPDVVTWDELYDRIKRVLGKRRATFHVPARLAKAGAAVVEALPGSFPMSRDAITMLEFEDNVGDIGPAVSTFGIHPIGLTEQIRRAAA
jgi:uncharacterized protein YbjT (DUF2867 family)